MVLLQAVKIGPPVGKFIMQLGKLILDHVLFLFQFGYFVKNKNTITAPEAFGKVMSAVKPRLAVLVDEIRRAGPVDVFVHSDGDISEILPDLVELGVTAVNPMQPEVMDLEAVSERYGDRISVFGGMSTQKTLPFGTTSDVKREMRELAKLFAPRGGFILSPGILLTEDVPMANVLAFVDTCMEQDFW